MMLKLLVIKKQNSGHDTVCKAQWKNHCNGNFT